MIIKALTFLLSCLFFSLVFVAPVQSGHDADMSWVESEIFFLINVARVDPLFVADFLGVDGDELFQDLDPESSFWVEHKWSLRRDDILDQTVKLHAQDMMENGYFGHESPQGFGPIERAVQAGYSLEALYEKMALLTFQHYIHPKRAGLELFKSFFIDEVQSYMAGQLSIFDQDIRELGLSFLSGRMRLGGRTHNAYLFIVQYGSSRENTIERYLARAINKARSSPMQALEYFNVDKAEASSSLGSMSWVLNRSLSPLYFSADSDLERHIQMPGSPSLHSPAGSFTEYTWEVHMARDVAPAEAAIALAGELFNPDNPWAFPALFDPWVDSSTLNVERSLCDPVDQNDECLYIVRLTTSEFFDLQTLLIGNVRIDDCEVQQIICADICGARIVVKDGLGEAFSWTMTDQFGDFRLEQLFGMNVWELYDREGVLLSSGTFMARHQNHWLEITLPLTDSCEHSAANVNPEYSN